jgi:hypothetical protein
MDKSTRMSFLLLNVSLEKMRALRWRSASMAECRQIAYLPRHLNGESRGNAANN